MCDIEFYLMIIVSLTFKIRIYRAIDLPGHGKYVVYGKDARDKIYMREKRIDYHIILPQLVKALLRFILLPVGTGSIWHCALKSHIVRP